MPSFETLLVLALGATVAVVAAVLFIALRRRPPGPAAAALARGDFAAALAAGGDSGERGEAFAAATAAKHLLALADAAAILDRLLAADPADGEAWLGRGLVAAYAGDPAAAEAAFSRVEASRADLLESLTLHRAWLALTAGDPAAARRRFEEIEAPLGNKLESDLGAGDLAFAEWFLQAAALWRAGGQAEKAAWALAQGRAAAPASPLVEYLAALPPTTKG
jgi:tetratricopeptide (TPR) repeat protein